MSNALLDENQIEQVVINLLLNALHAVAEYGKVSVTTCVDHETESIHIEVADNGCGIAEANLKKIFEPFFSTQNKGGRTWPGDQLWHRSEPQGRHSGFQCARRRRTIRDRVSNPNRSRRREGVFMKLLNVLVIDDETVIGDACRLVLSEKGCTVTHCITGKEGLN